jgi:hypothetical protein
MSPIRPTATRHPIPPRGTPGAPSRNVAARCAATSIALASCIAATASAATPPVAGAAPPPTVPVVEQPLQADAGSAAFATGEGLEVWATTRLEPGAKKLTIDLWWLKDGTPTKAGSVPDTSSYNDQSGVSGEIALETGTSAGGAPVVLVRTLGGGSAGVDHTTLMDLRTGKATKLPGTRRGLVVGGVAVDRGRAYFTLHRRKTIARSTSSLWSAPVTGTTIGKAKKLRTSRRGDVWFAVLADQGRVAINEAANPPKDHRSPYYPSYYVDDFAFGTPRGTWRRTDLIPVLDGPIPTHAMAGFTTGGKALVTLRTQGDDDLPTLLTLSPAAGVGGAKRSALLGSDPETSPEDGAFDAATGRILTAGTAADGTEQVGLSGVAFPPAG